MYGHMSTAHTSLGESTSNSSHRSLKASCSRQPECLVDYQLSSSVPPPHMAEWLSVSSPGSTRIPVWVWLSYPNGEPPRYIRLNMQALERHAPSQHFQLVVLNASTLGRWLPLPAEFRQLRGPVAASDVARIGLLATHGGIYLDADVLVSSSLRPLVRLLDKHETVAYSAPGQDCRVGQLSSNFLATRPNSTLWSRAWASMRAQLRNRCVPRRRPVRAYVCCYAANSTPIPCKSPWAFTDHVLRPVATAMAAEATLSVHCLGHNDGLTPMAFAHRNFTVTEKLCVGFLRIYTAALRVGLAIPTLGAGSGHATASNEWACGRCRSRNLMHGPNSTLCCRRRGKNLECRNPHGKTAKAANFFGRWAYHLFESINGNTFIRTEPIERSDLAVAALYRRALGLDRDGVDDVREGNRTFSAARRARIIR
jgi:hypothetical protein